MESSFITQSQYDISIDKYDLVLLPEWSAAADSVFIDGQVISMAFYMPHDADFTWTEEPTDSSGDRLENGDRIFAFGFGVSGTLVAC